MPPAFSREYLHFYGEAQYWSAHREVVANIYTVELRDIELQLFRVYALGTGG
jgi:hypothetical protein